MNIFNKNKTTSSDTAVNLKDILVDWGDSVSHKHPSEISLLTEAITDLTKALRDITDKEKSSEKTEMNIDEARNMVATMVSEFNKQKLTVPDDYKELIGY